MADYGLHPEVMNQSLCRLTMSVRRLLGELLDEKKISCVENGIPRDYRGLAQLAGLDALEITELDNEMQPTDRLISRWCMKDPECKVGKLIDHLEKLKCYYVLDEVIPVLDSAYEPPSPEIIEILPRSWWNLQERPLQIPLPAVVGLVFLEHTGRAEDVNEPLDSLMRALQSKNMTLSGGHDIQCNFVINPEGKIVEGTGWYAGDTPARYNHIAISIILVGDYNHQDPDTRMTAALHNLLQDLTRQGKLERDYALYGVSDILPTSSPGKRVMEAIKSWPCFHRKDELQQDWAFVNSGF